MAPTSKMALGIKRTSRSRTYHRRGLWAIKAKHGGAFPKAEKPAAVAEPKFYPADDVKPRTFSTRKPHPTKLRSTITPGTVLILLAGRYMGKRVVFLKQLKSGLLLITGPFKINGVPIRRVNQAYVISTSTRLDISKATKNLPDFKKDDQKVIDTELIKAIDAVPDLKSYLGARFSLRDGDKPHEMTF
ncbi:60S ribosomal protein L6-like isoform X2 [Hordeum vulgare subsp. vulgare]|uniref:60S ribosomal protein L6-like isoform X2 n=1 Tax=Hordeum vulgare subsp. vulgare TaxID=112509 RepID=UPI00162BFDFB|nr:60S ribosomal protein L6-like isoform X2 [Hordeum vulgare subsp. vulgare]